MCLSHGVYEILYLSSCKFLRCQITMLKFLLADIMLIVDLKILGTKWIFLDCFYVMDIEVWPFCTINN